MVNLVAIRYERNICMPAITTNDNDDDIIHDNPTETAIKNVL